MSDLPWEDGLLERKVESDLKDLLKTLVAFANSVSPGHVATILIGERDDGIVAGVTNPDSIQKKIREECEKIYPAIVWRSQVYVKEGKSCVRVEIEYGGNTPHFGGPAWVRRGSTTIKASEEVFQHLIELRLEKVRELSKWIGKEITIHGDDSNMPADRESSIGFGVGKIYSHRWDWQSVVKLVSVNKFWITVKKQDGQRASEPLDKLTLTFDDKLNQLMLIIRY